MRTLITLAAICLVLLAGCGGPTTSSEYVELAFETFNEGEYSDAVEYCTRAIELDPSNADAYNMRSLALGALGRFDDALVDATRAIELAPDEPVLYFNRSEIHKQLTLVHRDMAHAVKAKQDREHALRLQPDLLAD